MQRKYNGLRGLWLPDHQTLQSRDEILYDPAVIKHLLTELTSLPFVVDCEIYAHGMSLQDINSRMGVNRKSAHNDALAVGLVIFDIPSMKPFWQRAQDLEKLENWLANKTPVAQRWVTVAPTVEVTSQAEADYYYAQWRQEGYEGAMYKLTDQPYGFVEHCGNKENRWWAIQKRKGTEDLQARIINLKEGENGFAGMLGSFECVYAHPARGLVTFNAGSGLNIDQRQRYWNDPGCVLEQPIDIEFEMFSDNGTPLKPIVTLVHEAY